MKFNVLRAIMVPWILFFFLTVALFVLGALHFPALAENPNLHDAVLYGAGALCLIATLSTLNKAGIWVADSLPLSIRRSSMNWFVRAVISLIIAGAFWGLGQFPWMPLFWQGFVIPLVFSLCLFLFVRSLLGLILKKAANFSFTRVFVLVFSIPLLYVIGMTTGFLSQGILTSYIASQPEIQFVAMEANEEVPVAVVEAKDESKAPPVATAKRAQEFQAAAESKQLCPNLEKDIRNNLDPKVADDIAYWAVKAVKCTDTKAVIILPRLADLMMKHKNPQVRAAAVSMMLKFDHDTVKPIAYLLLKQLKEGAPSEVFEACANVLSKLGEEHRISSTNRLKGLLDTGAGPAAAKLLIHQFRHADLVSTYVTEHLPTPGEGRIRAIALICLLPQADRTAATQFISDITASIKSGSAKDPAMEALSCLGPVGLQAVRDEVQNPQRISRPLAAQALAEMDLKNDTESLKIVESCLKDQNEEVRKWCSLSMGKIGKIALPQILELLNSGDPDSLKSGRLALDSLNDPEAKDDLRRVRAENSGWMANQRRLQVANAVSTALVRIERATR